MGGTTGQDDRTILEEQMKREERSISSYRRYSSLADDPALTTILNEFVQAGQDRRNRLHALVGGDPVVDRNVFEEQVYNTQPGGSNPGGYRKGGTAGTESLPGSRASPEGINQAFRERPAGDNVGWQSSPLNDKGREDPRTLELRFSREDELLRTHLPPDVEPDDGALLQGALDAARLMSDAYADAASRSSGLEVGQALQSMQREADDQRRRLERYAEGRHAGSHAEGRHAE